MAVKPWACQLSERRSFVDNQHAQTVRSTPDAVSVKKVYHAPQLRDFGSVQELTLTGIGSFTFDGLSYTS
jgi:hypothetical protein